MKLGEVCERIDYGFTASADFATKGPRFLRITDIQNGSVNWEAVPGCAISDAETEHHCLHDGDIVFARTGATTGKSFLIKAPPRSVFASYLIRLRLKPNCDPEFISLFLQGEEYWQQIRSQARGGAQPNFNATMLAALRVRLPPLAEQRRIAERLREQMAEVARARAAVQAQLAAAQALPAAVLRTHFTTPAAQRWPQHRLTEVCEVYQPETISTREMTEGGAYPVFGANGIIGRYHRYNHEEAEVLLTCRGATCGSVNVSLARAWITGNAMVISPKTSGIEKEFLRWVIEAHPKKQEVITGSAQPQITRASLSVLDIPLPPLTEQRALAARLTAELSVATALRESLAQRLAAIERLPAALLRTAFNPPS